MIFVEDKKNTWSQISAVKHIPAHYLQFHY